MYIKPEIDIIEMEVSPILAASPGTNNGYTLDKNDENQYDRSKGHSSNSFSIWNLEEE